MTDTPLDEFAGALAAFQAEVPVVPKKQTAKIETQGGRNYSYTYADLASIAPVVMPLLAKHGLAFTCLPRPGTDALPPLLVGVLVHTSGQRVSGELPISGRTPQEIGSSLTYGRRYLLGCLTGVVTDDDDDGALATKAARTKTDRPPGVDPHPPVAPPIPIQRRKRPPVTDDPAPTDGETPHGPPSGPDQSEDKAPAPMRDPQRRALFKAVGEALPDAQRDERLALCSAVTGRHVESSNDLTMAEASAILRWLDDFQAGREAWQYDTETGLGYVWPTDPPVGDEPS